MIQDTFNRTARKLRISLTDRCQMRCMYCMPMAPVEGFLTPESWLNFNEIVTVAAVAEQHGVTSLRLTGGEPLIRPDTPRLIAMLRERTTLPRIAMTTNALMLPRLAADLYRAGLSDLTISLDTLKSERMRRVGGGDYLPGILRGIEAAQQAGFTRLKINSVVIRGTNDDEIMALAQFAWSIGAEPRFIEYMPLDELWQRDQVVTADEIVAQVQSWAGPVESISVPASSTAMRYRVIHSGTIFSVIPTLSHAFCGDCDRIRLTADGRVLGCLYSTTGPSVRDVLRTDPADTGGVARVLRLAYTERGIGYMQQLQSSPQRIEHSTAMYAVGG